MPQSLAKIAVHVIFSTKSRRPWLRDSAIRDQLYRRMGTLLRTNVDSPAIIINGVDDHIHALLLLSRKFALMRVIQEMKAPTSMWLKTRSPTLEDFAWQRGYGAFSVSESNIPEVTRYIENQEKHHRHMTFQEEFRELCRRNNVAIDERYVWD